MSAAGASTSTSGYTTSDVAAPLGSGPLGRCVTVGVAVFAVDIGTKIIATSLLGSDVVPLVRGTFLGVVHNDTFGRGAMLGSLTAPATLLLAAVLLYVIARVCAPLAAVDAAAPRALGFVAGAAAANAIDLVRTGRGVVDFLGVPTAHGAIVFNLADIAAYIGVVLLARTAWLVARAAWQERMISEPLPRYPRLHAAAQIAWAQRHGSRRNVELVRPVPIFVENPPTTGPDDLFPVPPRPTPTRPSTPDRHAPPVLGESDLTKRGGDSESDSTSGVSPRPMLTLIVNRPPR